MHDAALPTSPVSAIASSDWSIASEQTQVSKMRLSSIDTLRGLVMVLMALDHVRDYFSNVHQGLLDPKTTTIALYVTRWITHLCAPTFILLAGVSAYFMTKRLSHSQLSRFLVTRGLWLIFLELTVISFFWTYNFNFLHTVYLQVIWAIGISMLILAAVIRLSPPVILGIALVIIVGHNALDGIQAQSFGALAPLWNLIHVRGVVSFGDVVYPIVPWCGVMMLGFSLGRLYDMTEGRRRSWLFTLGFGALAAFIVLRLSNSYGDPSAWHAGPTITATLMYFMDVAKYPPSLLYLLVTLGIALILLAVFESPRALAPIRFLEVYGRVPLFFYGLHIALAHLAAGLVALLLGFGTQVLIQRYNYVSPDWGVTLGWVYLAWLFVVASLYPACRWFANVKKTRRDWWLSYL